MRSVFVTILIASGVVLAAALVSALQLSRRPVAGTLLRNVLTVPKPPDASPREHLVAAARFTVVFVSLLGVAAAFFWLGERWKINTTPNTVISAVGLSSPSSGFILAGMSSSRRTTLASATCASCFREA